MSDGLSRWTRCSSCFKFINSCEQKFREVIMKAAFVFLVSYQLFECSSLTMSYQTFPNINLQSFSPQNGHPNLKVLTLTHSDPAAQWQINTPVSKYCDKTGFTLRRNTSTQPHLWANRDMLQISRSFSTYTQYLTVC